MLLLGDFTEFDFGVNLYRNIRGSFLLFLIQLCEDFSLPFGTQLLQFFQLCNSITTICNSILQLSQLCYSITIIFFICSPITTIFSTLQLNYYNFLNFASQLLEFSQFCNSITTIFSTLHPSYYNFLNFTTQLLQFSQLCNSNTTIFSTLQLNYYNFLISQLSVPQEPCANETLVCTNQVREILIILFTPIGQSIYQNTENFLPWHSLLFDPQS